MSPPPAPPPAASRRGRRASAPPNPFGRVVQYVHALTGDGKFHSFYVSNGEEPSPPVSFLPPNANAQGLIVFEKTAYVSTTNSCGGVQNGVWALNLDSREVTHWRSGGSGVARSARPAAGSHRNPYVAGARRGTGLP